MTYQEVLKNASACSGPYCKACPVCNGKACGKQVPGPGSKGMGDTAIRNYDAWKKIRVNLDTIAKNVAVDTSFDFFGHKLRIPVLAGPVGAVRMHYGEKYNDVEYNNILVPGCANSGIIAMTGDGTDGNVMVAACGAIKSANGFGVPTVKPWDIETLKGKFDLVRSSDCFAVAMDIDAAGLPFLQNLTPPAGSKTVEELKEIVAMAGKPFILKGIMTVEGALKARDAGASGIVVSNHGGRVLDQCPATAEVLYDIAKAVGNDMMILVDGGIRDGVDVFKALAMGADGVVIARPYVTSVYGGEFEGIEAYTAKLEAELKDTMRMCGVSKLADLSEKNLFKPSNPFFKF